MLTIHIPTCKIPVARLKQKRKSARQTQRGQQDVFVKPHDAMGQFYRLTFVRASAPVFWDFQYDHLQCFAEKPVAKPHPDKDQWAVSPASRPTGLSVLHFSAD
jgi:hypothetical protein